MIYYDAKTSCVGCEMTLKFEDEIKLACKEVYLQIDIGKLTALMKLAEFSIVEQKRKTASLKELGSSKQVDGQSVGRPWMKYL